MAAKEVGLSRQVTLNPGKHEKVSLKATSPGLKKEKINLETKSQDGGWSGGSSHFNSPREMRELESSSDDGKNVLKVEKEEDKEEAS